MEKKAYYGLEAEFIPFGENDIATDSIWAKSGCTVGAMAYYTHDQFNNPVPLGSCWYDGNPDNLSFDWGGTIYGGVTKG